jgi:hypothetical protein
MRYANEPLASSYCYTVAAAAAGQQAPQLPATAAAVDGNKILWTRQQDSSAFRYKYSDAMHSRQILPNMWDLWDSTTSQLAFLGLAAGLVGVGYLLTRNNRVKKGKKKPSFFF